VQELLGGKVVGVVVVTTGTVVPETDGVGDGVTVVDVGVPGCVVEGAEVGIVVGILEQLPLM